MNMVTKAADYKKTLDDLRDSKYIEYVRNELKDGLSLCTEKQQERFILIYRGMVNYTRDMTVYDIVDVLSIKQLETALKQVENTVGESTNE